MLSPGRAPQGLQQGTRRDVAMSPMSRLPTPYRGGHVNPESKAAGSSGVDAPARKPRRKLSEAERASHRIGALAEAIARHRDIIAKLSKQHEAAVTVERE